MFAFRMPGRFSSLNGITPTTRRVGRRLGLVLAVPAVLVTAAFVPSPAAASIDRDGISAVTAGGRVDGYIDWQDFAGHVYSNVLLKDTAADSRCADLYFGRAQRRGCLDRVGLPRARCGRTSRSGSRSTTTRSRAEPRDSTSG